MENTSKQVEEAAEVAAEAASLGVSAEAAKDLATGKSRIVIVDRAPGGGKTAEEVLRERQDVIDQAKTLYGSCIDAGGDPKTCANMVAGLIPSQAGISSPPATSLTELINALVQLDGLLASRGSNTGLTELKASFDNLANELRQGGPRAVTQQDPIEYAKQQAGAVVAWKKVIDEIAPQAAASNGKELDVVKEENRHSEKMEEIKGERDYKESITEIAAEIPERIGHGIASRIGANPPGSAGAGAGDGGVQYLLCKKKGCGTNISFTTESKTITCPKCNEVYERGEEPEKKTAEEKKTGSELEF